MNLIENKTKYYNMKQNILKLFLNELGQVTIKYYITQKYEK